MITITFYSYKGGVGRSLALANIASRLSEFNKKVCLIDFDLEAPGLQYKFTFNQSDQIKKGIVDYIYSYSNEGDLPKSIIEYTLKLETFNENNPIFLIPAGKSDSKNYWRKLSLINWHQLLYENENGLAFFLDLKEKIKKEINADFLLIDSRTGISEMSGVALSLMADEVVVVAANNTENLYGAKKIISSISDPANSILGKLPKITFVLSRIPFTDKPFDKVKEQFLINRIKKNFDDLYTDDIVIVHSDRELEEDEKLKINSESDDGISPISKDYLKLFGKIIERHLTPDEIQKFNTIKQAERLYRLAVNKENISDQIELVSEAIRIVPTNMEYYLFRANAYESLKVYDKALGDYLKVLEIDKNNSNAIRSIGDLYFDLGDFDKSFEYYNILINNNPRDHYPHFRKALIYDKLGDKAKELEEYKKALELNPDDGDIYNNLSTHFREEGNIDKAFEYIYKALELNPLSAFAFSTLAEIYGSINKTNEFYLNLELALINKGEDDEDLEEAISKEEVYKKYYNDERFKKLMEKYNISIANITD